MGPSVAFALPLRIAQTLPVRKSWELIINKLSILLPIFKNYFELIREVKANTGHCGVVIYTITVVIRYLWRKFPVKFPQENKVFQRPCRSVLLQHRSVFATTP